MAADHDHEIAIKGGSFDLSDLGHLLPGMAEVMPLVGERIWKCYYAAQAHNRKLAAFQLKEAVNLMQKGSILRPKYEEDIDGFVAAEVATLQANIEGRVRDQLPRHGRPGERLPREVRQGLPALAAAVVAPTRPRHDGDLIQVCQYSGPEPPSGGVRRPPLAEIAPHCTQFDAAISTSTRPSSPRAPAV